MKKSDLSSPLTDAGSIDRIRKELFRLNWKTFSGYVFDPDDPERRFVVELLVDGFATVVALCNLYSHEASALGYGDACCGFVFQLPSDLLNTGKTAEVRLANLNAPIGDPIVLRTDFPEQGFDIGPGKISWLGGLSFAGFLSPKDEQSPHLLKAFIDGELVVEPRTSGWSHVTLGATVQPVPSFEFELPSIFADGRAHEMTAVDSHGEALRGSPVPFIAFADGLRSFLTSRMTDATETARIALIDRMLPQTLPFEEAGNWLNRYPLALAPEVAPVSAAVCLVGEGDLDVTLQSLAEQNLDDWVAAALRSGKSAFEFEPADLMGFLQTEAEKFDVVVFSNVGAKFEANGVRTLLRGLDAFAETEIAYCDIVLRFPDETLLPLAFPAFDYERCLEQGYPAFCFAMSKRAVAAAAARGADNLFSLFQDPAATAPVHVPGFCATMPFHPPAAFSGLLARATGAHLRRRGASAKIQTLKSEIFPAVRVERKISAGRVTIVIPTDDDIHAAKTCLEALKSATKKRDVEYLIIVGAAWRQTAIDELQAIDAAAIRIVSVDVAGNLARCCNRAAELATGEFLWFVAPGVTDIAENCLDELLGRLADSDAGAVGPLLCAPDKFVECGGLTLNFVTGAARAFANRSSDDGGYGECLRVARECSAISFECALMRLDAYRQAGGMDEIRHPRFFHDVDLSLRLRFQGKRLIFTPHTNVALRRGRLADPGERSGGDRRYENELANLRATWGATLSDDPYYSPLLGLGRYPFAGLAWPPRALTPRPRLLPRPASAPKGF